MKSTRFIAYVILLALCATPALAREKSSDVEAALGQWKAAVEAGKVDDIMKLYDRNAIMISTFAQEPMTKREQIAGYFKKVVTNPDIKVVVEDSHTRLIGNNVAVISGRYTLSYSQEGEPISIPARFSVVYQLEGGQWLIVNMHSSRVPLPDEGQ